MLQEALRSYTGAVSGVGDPVQDMNKLIAESACQQSKYMKIIFDKVKNYTLKTLNNQYDRGSFFCSIKHEISGI